MNNSQPNIKDIWIIHYSVPNKNKDNLLRPFIIVNIINKNIWNSFNILQRRIWWLYFWKSIIKPYQIIKIKPKYFKNKIGKTDDEIINKINNSINLNVFKYLSMKNINTIIREYTIEQQKQKITELELKNEQPKLELKLTKNQLLSQEKDLELE